MTARASKDVAGVGSLGGRWLTAPRALRAEAPSEPEPWTKACCRRRNRTAFPWADAQTSAEPLLGHQTPAWSPQAPGGTQAREGQLTCPGPAGAASLIMGRGWAQSQGQRLKLKDLPLPTAVRPPTWKTALQSTPTALTIAGPGKETQGPRDSKGAPKSWETRRFQRRGPWGGA